MHEFIKELIPLKQTKKKCVYISNTCPFNNCTSKNGRIFRYNSKLKVCKCFSCGVSVKELTSLKLAIENPLRFKIRNIITDTILDSIPYGDKIKELQTEELLKEKVDTNTTAIVKGETDYNLPF